MLLHHRLYIVPIMTQVAKVLKRTERYEESNEHFILEDLTVMSDFEIRLL